MLRPVLIDNGPTSATAAAATPLTRAEATPATTASAPAPFQRSLPPHLTSASPQLLRCCFCGADSADIMGDHFLSCLSGGYKTLQHNKIVDIFVREANRAHAMPNREPVLFNNSNIRADLSMRLPGAGRDAPLVTDVAITHFGCATTLQAGHIGANVAATAYQQQHKDPKYRQPGLEPLLQFRGMRLLPCVFDSLGAPAPDAQQFINLLGGAIAHATSTHRSVVIRELHHRICFTIAQSSARRIVAGVAAVNDALDQQLERQNATQTHAALLSIDSHPAARETGDLARTGMHLEGDEGTASEGIDLGAGNAGGSP